MPTHITAAGGRRLLTGTLACLCGISAQVPCAHAGQPEAEALEELVVSARKRDERAQDVPIAITTLSASVLERAGIEQVAELVQLVPNVTFQSGINMGENHLTIRGLSQIQNGPPPAAIVQDGVLLISPSMQFNVEEFDLERVEVLKGPQGALYGRNAIGGAINILTRAPSDELEISAMAGLAHGNEYTARAAVGGPLVDEKLLARASVSYRNRDGQLRNETNGHYMDHLEDLSARLRFLLRPSDVFELDLKLGYSTTHGGDPAYVSIPVDGMPNENELPVTTDTIGNNPRIVRDVSGKASWTTDAGTLSLIGAYLRGSERLFADFDVTALPILTAFREIRDSGSSQEIRFTSPSARRFRWIVGGYHVRSHSSIRTLGLADIGFFLDPPAPTGSIDFPVLDNTDHRRFENHAAFGQAELDLDDRLEIAVALRYDDDRIELNDASEASFSKLQPKLTLRYRVSPAVTLYSSYGEGFRSGDFNPSEATIGEAVMRAEEGRTAELGMKSTLLAQRLSVNVAAFHMKLKDAQQQVLDFTTGANVGLNIDRSTIRGFEIETAAFVGHGLALNVSGGMVDSRIDRFSADPGVRGNKLPRVPDYTINAGASYERPLSGSWGLFLRTDYNRLGRAPWHLDNADVRRQVDYLNLRIGARTDDERWTVSAWLKNALDDRTTQDFQAVEYSGNPFGLDAYSPMVGRTYGVDVSARL